jgi:uncharacterized protein YkwD
MKVYRSLLGILIFFAIIYAFKGYLNPSSYDFFGNSPTSSATLGTSSGSLASSTNTGLPFPENIASSLLNDIKKLDPKGGYTPNRDQLPPIIGEDNTESRDGKLTDDGVFFGTNIERGMQSLPILKRNSVLDRSAEVKLNDMFSNQYFEHVSPNGSGVSDVVGTVGYKFLIIGENLALGNFAGDAKVVAAWMASPGHRENILDKRYTEIGVAVGYGMYKGRMQWLAVQHFARPMSSCPSPNAGLKDRIAKDKEELAFKEGDIASMKKVVDKMEASDTNFESVVSSYNALVNDYNNRLKDLKVEISSYNAEVNNFNSCLDAVTTSV